MGVYLPNMELPKEYGPHVITITLFVRDDGTASLWGKEVFIPHEPLEVVSVPPHGRLIDADALDTSILQAGFSYAITRRKLRYTPGEVREKIANAPTIIPASEED